MFKIPLQAPPFHPQVGRQAGEERERSLASHLTAKEVQGGAFAEQRRSGTLGTESERLLSGRPARRGRFTG
jgi:hypothetical protein